MRDAILDDLVKEYDLDISIHASHARCDNMWFGYTATRQNISIHASHARCDNMWSGYTATRQNISIHASHARCDICTCINEIGFKWFQFTHLMRDVIFNQNIKVSYNSISIHASHARCDIDHDAEYVYLVNFNSRISCEMRLSVGNLLTLKELFQFTHLMRDAMVTRFL